MFLSAEWACVSAPPVWLGTTSGTATFARVAATLTSSPPHPHIPSARRTTASRRTAAGRVSVRVRPPRAHAYVHHTWVPGSRLREHATTRSCWRRRCSGQARHKPSFGSRSSCSATFRTSVPEGISASGARWHHKHIEWAFANGVFVKHMLYRVLELEEILERMPCALEFSRDARHCAQTCFAYSILNHSRGFRQGELAPHVAPSRVDWRAFGLPGRALFSDRRRSAGSHRRLRPRRARVHVLVSGLMYPCRGVRCIGLGLWCTCTTAVCRAR